MTVNYLHFFSKKKKNHDDLPCNLYFSWRTKWKQKPITFAIDYCLLNTSSIVNNLAKFILTSSEEKKQK